MREIAAKGAAFAGGRAADSVFFGGGTPSCVRHGVITGALGEIRRRFRVEAGAEITVEANPGTLDAEKLDAYLAAGANRLSLGAQSMDDGTLALLGRPHDREGFVAAFGMARAAGFKNINVDLIFAAPGQTEAAWEGTLADVAALRPEHISFYPLMIEEGTELHRRRESGGLQPVDEKTDRRMYHAARRILENNGYSQYELSNAAREGWACRHNLKYWSMQEYVGVGLGAHSFIGGARSENVRDMGAYLDARAPGDFEAGRHVNSEYDWLTETLFLCLRRTAGIGEAEFAGLTGRDFSALRPSGVESLVSAGLLEVCGGPERRMRLTARGMDVANAVFVELMLLL
jgi:oxygen-independent coproporphyrinogen-3 oxidase